MLSEQIIVLFLQEHIATFKITNLSLEIIHGRLHLLCLSDKSFNSTLVLGLASLYFLDL